MEKQKIYLSNQEIDNVCKELVNRISEKHPHYKSYINFIYMYGCRINELFDYRIFYNAETFTIEIIPQKKNNNRYLRNVPLKAIKWVEEINQTQPLFYLNKRNLQRIIEKEMPIRNLKCGNKNIGGHLFRHNYIKKLVADGGQVENINLLMGYTTQTIADTYAISQIYYEI